MTKTIAAAAMPASTVPARMTSTPRRVGPVSGVIIAIVRPRSDFEADHLGHDEHADAHPHEAAEPGDHEPLIDEEVGEIALVDPPDQAEDDERQRADDIGGGLGFGAHRLDLELHLRALAQHVGEIA